MNTDMAMIPKQEFPTWKLVKLGTHSSLRDLETALTRQYEDRQFSCVPPVVPLVPEMDGSVSARHVFRSMQIAPAETEVELVMVPMFDLGIVQGEPTPVAHIYARARSLGLDVVPAEVGPQLHRQYINRPVGERLLIGMEPLEGLIFVVHCENGLKLFRQREDTEGTPTYYRTGTGLQYTGNSYVSYWVQHPPFESFDTVLADNLYWATEGGFREDGNTFCPACWVFTHHKQS